MSKRAEEPQAFPKPSRKERRAEERAEREAKILETANLRGQAWLRAAERPRFARDRGQSPPPCEFCGGRKHALQLHHLEGGRGRRRETQHLGNVALICGGPPESCHERWGRDPRAIEAVVLEFCERNGLDLPAYFRRPARVLAEAMAAAEAARRSA
jgi:hypothetical protein